MKAYRRTLSIELTLTGSTPEDVEELHAVVLGELEGRNGVRIVRTEVPA